MRSVFFGILHRLGFWFSLYLGFVEHPEVQGSNPMDLKKVSEAEAKIKALEAENTEMRETLNAVKNQLAVFESLILYPTYFYELERYPESQKGMVELAMKANFFKTSHEIRQKTEENMKEIWSKRGSH